MTRGKQIWRVAWRVAVCLLLLAWIFQAIFWNEGKIAWEQAGSDWESLTRWERLEVAWTEGPPGLWRTLQMMQPAYLALSIVLMGAILFLGVLRWQIILRVHGLGLPLGRTSEISLIAHFFNSFLLGSVGGDLLKAFYVARETHHKKTEAVITVAADRIIGLFSLLLVACLMMIPNRDILVFNTTTKTATWLILGMTAGCAGFITLSFWGGISRGIPSAREWLRKLPKGAVVERSLEAFREFGRDKTFFLRVLPISMLMNVVCIFHFLVLLWGFGLSAPLLALAVIVPMVTSISTLPITPSGLGVRENLYVLMLAAVAIPPAEALLVSLIGFGTSLFWSVIGGFVYLTVKDKEHLTEIAEETKQEEMA